LKRHHHGTPEEMAEVKFYIKCPIFVKNQILRHRTANVNEFSRSLLHILLISTGARYAEVPDEFYHPEIDEVNVQSTMSKQGSAEPVQESIAEQFIQTLSENEKKAFESYKGFLAQGIARETSRMILPVNIYTQFFFKIDLRNLFHFLNLRMDVHAQYQTRRYACAMFQLISDIFPVSCQAFIDYQFKAITLTRLEVEAIRNKKDELNTKNKRENDEWKEKKLLLSL
jgi:thymidylate synthase (FAD)